MRAQELEITVCDFKPGRIFKITKCELERLEMPNWRFKSGPIKATRRNGLMPSINPRPENVAPLIRVIRGEKVLLDSDLATLYGVEARALNQAVARNRARFPADFMFRLSSEEFAAIRSQSVTASEGRKMNSSQIVMSSRKHRRIGFTS